MMTPDIRGRFKGALIDMDGVLFDSMKGHTRAWQEMMRTAGVECDRDEFYLYEGDDRKSDDRPAVPAHVRPRSQRRRGETALRHQDGTVPQLCGPAPLIEGADRMLRARSENWDLSGYW